VSAVKFDRRFETGNPVLALPGATSLKERYLSKPLQRLQRRSPGTDLANGCAPFPRADARSISYLNANASAFGFDRRYVARIEYLEWTDGDHLRHSKFAGLRVDKRAQDVNKEHAGEA
jgi:ATP-dependent DNA ligase